MEITAQMRTDLIEAVRTARTVVDTGWPRDLDATPEIAQMENFLRAGLVNMVSSKLMMHIGVDEFHLSEMDAFTEWRKEIREIVQLLTEKQRLLAERVDTQVELNSKLLGTLGTTVTKLVGLAEEVKELAGEVRAGRESGGS